MHPGRLAAQSRCRQRSANPPRLSSAWARSLLLCDVLCSRAEAVLHHIPNGLNILGTSNNLAFVLGGQGGKV